MQKKETARRQDKNKNPNNPNNSTLIQGLLELLKSDDISDDVRKQVKDLKTALDNQPDAVKLADTAVRNKHYADDKLTFYKTPSYNINPGIHKILSPEQYCLLSILASIMSQDNLVRLSTDNLIELSGLKERTVKKHMVALLKGGYIAIHTPAIPKASIPRVYMINPEIFDCGKPSPYKVSQFWSLSSVNKKSFMQDLRPETDYKQGLIVLASDTDKKAKIGTLELIYDNKKADCADS